MESALRKLALRISSSRAKIVFFIRRLLNWIRYKLPEWPALAEDVWARRHRGVLVLLWLHAVGLAISGVFIDAGLSHTVSAGALLALAALVAGQKRGGRRFRSVVSTIGLLTASALLVHLSGGYIEMHFHFFVMLSVMMLYQDWIPFLVAFGYVVAHHGIVGVLAPTHVYNHPGAWEHPWQWAAVHGLFVVAAGIANLVNWRLNEHQALYDSLTKLSNRMLFHDRLKQALARTGALARRRSLRKEQLAVLFIDLDAFKQVNDGLGHTAGDQLLIQVAERLSKCLRTADTLARLGGDEFAILLEDLLQPTNAAEVAERLIAALADPFDIWGKEVFIQASIGIVISAGSVETVEELLRNADVAMYKAKAQGKGRYEIYASGMHAQVMERLELETDLRRAIERQEFILEFQPVMALSSDRITTVEALVRWEHPSRGRIPPGDFIPLAEETGLIVPLGTWVIEQACRQASLWSNCHPLHPRLAVSVNISARQFQDANLMNDIARILRECELDPQNLILEITESVLIQDPEAICRKLQEFKDMGLRLALDDFGTGYSSLSYLRQIPIDILKIDKSFVSGPGSEDAAVTASIVDLAHTLGLQTVAEGIEEFSQLVRIKAMGCEYAQGYYLSRPLNPDRLNEMLQSSTVAA